MSSLWNEVRIALRSLSRVLKSILFGVAPSDPLTILSMIGVIVIVAVLASIIPAGRAVAVDPAITLRTE
ncbi:MAG: hypothetical protein ACREOG_20645 [Gemmatimonadaceae bacterium]